MHVSRSWMSGRLAWCIDNELRHPDWHRQHPILDPLYRLSLPIDAPASLTIRITEVGLFSRVTLDRREATPYLTLYMYSFPSEVQMALISPLSSSSTEHSSGINDSDLIIIGVRNGRRKENKSIVRKS